MTVHHVTQPVPFWCNTDAKIIITNSGDVYASDTSDNTDVYAEYHIPPETIGISINAILDKINLVFTVPDNEGSRNAMHTAICRIIDNELSDKLSTASICRANEHTITELFPNHTPEQVYEYVSRKLVYDYGIPFYFPDEPGLYRAVSESLCDPKLR